MTDTRVVQPLRKPRTHWGLRPALLVLVASLLVATGILGVASRSDPQGDPAAYLWLADVQVEDYPNVSMDTGIPRVRYDGVGYVVNPVTLCQWGLAHYSRGETRQLFAAADWLVRNQRSDGAWPYRFDWYVESADDTLRAPWISGLAQGQALSLLARAHALTGENKYLTAGQRALHPFTVPVDDGGVLQYWRGHPFYEEYPTPHRPSLVLNGYLFALIGLHEWATATGDSLARDLWVSGEETAAALIPMYDLGDGASAYGLAFREAGGPEAVPVTGSVYAPIHPALATKMHELTGRPVYAQAAARWEVPGKPWGLIAGLLLLAAAIAMALWRVRHRRRTQT